MFAANHEIARSEERGGGGATEDGGLRIQVQVLLVPVVPRDVKNPQRTWYSTREEVLDLRTTIQYMDHVGAAALLTSDTTSVLSSEASTIQWDAGKWINFFSLNLHMHKYKYLFF